MKKYCIFGLMVSMIPALCMAEHPRVTELIRIKQEKMEKLEKCSGTTNGLKIAGISTLGVTAVGVAGNIAEAAVRNKYDKKLSDVDSKIDATQLEIDQKLKDNIEKQNREDERQKRLAEEQQKQQAAQDESRRLKNVVAQDIATINSRGSTLGDVAVAHGYKPEQLPDALPNQWKTKFADAMIRFMTKCRGLINSANGIKNVSVTSEKWNPQTMAEVNVLDENAILPDLNEYTIAQCIATECEQTHTLSNGTCVPKGAAKPEDDNGKKQGGDQNGNNDGKGGKDNNQGGSQGDGNQNGDKGKGGQNNGDKDGKNNQGGDQGKKDNQGGSQGDGDQNGDKGKGGDETKTCTKDVLDKYNAETGEIINGVCVPKRCKGDLILVGKSGGGYYGKICKCPDNTTESQSDPTKCVPNNSAKKETEPRFKDTVPPIDNKVTPAKNDSTYVAVPEKIQPMKLPNSDFKDMPERAAFQQKCEAAGGKYQCLTNSKESRCFKSPVNMNICSEMGDAYPAGPACLLRKRYVCPPTSN